MVESPDIVLPRPLAQWAIERGLTTIGALLRAVPHVGALREAGISRATIKAARREIGVRCGHPWSELAELLTAASPAAAGIAEIEIQIPRPRPPPKPKQPPKTSLGERRAEARRLAVIARAEGRGRQVEAGLVPSLRALFDEQPERVKRVLCFRAGLEGPPPTFQQMSGELGVTRERVRQIEQSGLQWIRAEVGWVDPVRRHVDAALKGAAVPLDELAREPWWAEIAASPDVVDFVGRELLGGAMRRLEIDGRVFVAAFPAEEIERAHAALRLEVTRLPLPTTLSAVRSLLGPTRERLGAGIADLLFERLRKELEAQGSGPEAQVTSAGASARVTLRAVLLAAPQPLRLPDLPRRLQQAGLSPDMIRFGFNLVGLAHHFPDMAAWSERLVPPAVRWMERQPERQWHAGELLEALREQVALPAWLDDWHLAALLQHSGKVLRLGRRRFSLPSSADTKRVFFRDRVVRLLLDHGRPMPHAELREALALETSITRSTLRVLASHPPFLLCSGERIGLIDRHLPGGEPARAAAVEHVVGLLQRRGHGLTEVELAHRLRRLSAEHKQWCGPMCLSVMRTDARFRLARSGGVGLSTWESARVPSQAEILAACLDEGGGRAKIEVVKERVAARHGIRLGRMAVYCLARQVGAILEWDWVIRPSP